ncbi:hypothetical protein F7725_013399, partial [Dissostichus mawsoni]
MRARRESTRKTLRGDDNDTAGSSWWNGVFESWRGGYGNKKKDFKKEDDMSSDSLSESDSQNEMKRTKKRIENEEWKVIVEFGEQAAAKLHPVALTKAIHKELGSIKQARFLSKGRMLVEMINAKQQEKLLKMKTLNEVQIKCHVPGANRKIL